MVFFTTIMGTFFLPQQTPQSKLLGVGHQLLNRRLETPSTTPHSKPHQKSKQNTAQKQPLLKLRKQNKTSAIDHWRPRPLLAAYLNPGYQTSHTIKKHSLPWRLAASAKQWHGRGQACWPPGFGKLSAGRIPFKCCISFNYCISPMSSHSHPTCMYH